MNLRTSELSLRSGLAFIATSKVQALAIGKQRLRLVINNPAGSKRNLVFGGMVVDNSLSGMLTGAMQLNPTNGPTGAGNAGIITNQNFDPLVAKSSVATMFTGTTNTALDGQNVANFGIPGGERTTLDEVAFILPPGASLGLDVSFTALLVLAQATIMVYWAEEMLQ